MNFSILNSRAAYYSQQVQSTRSVNNLSTEANIGSDAKVNSTDRVTLSARALAGEKSNAVDSHTYDHLQNMQRVVIRTDDKVAPPEPSNKPQPLAHIDTSNFLADAMASIVEGRLGVDKEKLKEIEAMMEEVGKDESLSPEEKEKRLADLQELLDKEYEKAAEKQLQQPL